MRRLHRLRPPGPRHHRRARVAAVDAVDRCASLRQFAVRGILAPASAIDSFLAAGDYFGERALLRRDGRRTATVVALEPGRTLPVSRVAFDRLCASNPGIERAVTVVLAHRVEQLSGRLLETMDVSLDRRPRPRRP